MATPKTNAAATQNVTPKTAAEMPKNQAEIDALAEEGFKKVTIGVHYYKPAPGARIVCIPLMRAERETNIDPTKKGYYYLAVTTRPAMVATPGGDMVEVGPGEVVLIDERWGCQALKPLLPLVSVDSKTGEEKRKRFIEVAVTAVEQRPTSKPGQKVWIFDIRQKPADEKALALASKVDHAALLGYTPPDEETMKLLGTGAPEEAAAN